MLNKKIRIIILGEVCYAREIQWAERLKERAILQGMVSLKSVRSCVYAYRLIAVLVKAINIKFSPLSEVFGMPAKKVFARNYRSLSINANLFWRIPLVEKR